MNELSSNDDYTHCVKTYSEITITIVNDTNIIAKNNVNVCDERHSFEGGLQKLISTTFCEYIQCMWISIQAMWLSRVKKLNDL